jgi:energy-coupling factor transporter ATP-binding protein EcfA2
MDMITYAAELRLDPAVVNIKQRVDDIITVMNLHHCKNRRIVEYPAMRGELGCDLRRLSIAIEVVHLPPLIVVDEPTWDFEPAISVKVIECLKSLANRGHIVVCSMSKPSASEFSMLDRAVLLMEGHSVYSGPPLKIEQHFCGDEMGYVRKKGVDLVEFTADICSGVERPNNLRAPEPPSIMQEKFEASALFDAPSKDAGNCQAFCREFFNFFGYTANTHGLTTHWKRFVVVLRRAIVTKLKDKRSLQGYFMAAFVLSSLVGYLQYGQATYGHYCLSLLGVPYANTTNVGSTMFFLALFTQAFFFNDSNAYCQKLQLFRYEQASSCGNVPAFFVATAISEVPFAIGFALIFSNIIYFMVQFYSSRQDYGFYITTLVLSSLCGMSSAIMYCAIFKKELVVRDMFFFSLIVVVLLSGFPFSQASMPDYMVQFSSVIPTRYGAYFCDNPRMLYLQFHRACFVVSAVRLLTVNLTTTASVVFTCH